ncbi:MAG: AAA family ATPase [Gammaproteobacteria bacterium]|nr:AAA family ATPase [Gammaproteobacteria bacterium]
MLTIWIEREIAPSLKQISQSFPILVLVGPRQVGKTSLIERIFSEYTHVSLDVGSYAEMAETQPEAFLNQFNPPVVIDEIQYAPSFFRYIKTYVDQHRGENGLFILTGS